MPSGQRATLLLLDEGSSETAMVRMEDGDKFLIAVTEAALACHAFDQGKKFARQFGDLIRTLTDWLSTRRDKVKKAHLVVRESDMLFLVVQKSQTFDSNFSDAMTELDIDIANSADLDLIQLEVLLIPSVSEEASLAFMSSGTIYTYPHA